MRVTGGELGGRPLQAPRGRSVRPTADRVREALFSTLGDLAGCDVFDGFAGSGSLGIEALSRGAARAVFVERSPRVLAVLRANLHTLGVEERAEVRRGDVVQALRRLAAEEAPPRFDWIFLDPPYRGDDAARALAALSELRLLAPGGGVVVETSRFHPLEDPPAFRRLDERRYGDTVVVYLALRGG